MFTLNCKGQLWVVDKPVVMGILNLTPDSFYTGSRMESVDDLLRQAEQMLLDGALILDLGAQSTRPGSARIGEEEELKRLLPGMEALHHSFPDARLSVDTYSAKVAMYAVQSGASIVNDISAGEMDPAMIPTVARLQAPYICMHMKGTPETMQMQPSYNDVTTEVLDYLIRKVKFCREQGIRDVIIDPGFGFGKSIRDNFTLLKNLAAFRMLDCPVLVGLSRKSTIYKTLGVSADEALNGTTVLNTIGLLNGAQILRVHDVKEAVETVKLVWELEGN